jgi:hypothetical protein
MSNTSSEDALRFEVITTEGLRRALSMIFSDSTFACGGTIKAKQPEQTSLADALLAAGHAKKSVAEDQVQALAEPITIRWDSATSIEKLTLPLSGNEINKENSDIAKLAAGTQPASFGFYGQDVIDESYRKASKLDTSAFSTNFCPYESGIIDIIGQALPPKSPGSTQGIRAELYKLNVSLVLNFQGNLHLLTSSRSTKLLLVSSSPTLTLHVQNFSSAHSWCACPVITRAASSLCAIEVGPQSLIGPVLPRTLSGRPFTVTASMRSMK